MKYVCPADLHPNWKIPNQQYLLNVLNMQRVLRKGFRLSFGYVINISCHTQELLDKKILAMLHMVNLPNHTDASQSLKKFSELHVNGQKPKK